MHKSTLSKVTGPKALARHIVQGLQDMKGLEIVELNMKNVDGADVSYMVICHATSNRHGEGLARSVEETVLKAAGEKPWHAEGNEIGEWILLDYIDVVVHIFLKEKRDFFNLEDLWGDAEITRYPSE